MDNEDADSLGETPVTETRAAPSSCRGEVGYQHGLVPLALFDPPNSQTPPNTHFRTDLIETLPLEDLMSKRGRPQGHNQVLRHFQKYLPVAEHLSSVEPHRCGHEGQFPFFPTPTFNCIIEESFILMIFELNENCPSVANEVHSSNTVVFNYEHIFTFCLLSILVDRLRRQRVRKRDSTPHEGHTPMAVTEDSRGDSDNVDDFELSQNSASFSESQANQLPTERAASEAGDGLGPGRGHSRTVEDYAPVAVFFRTTDAVRKLNFGKFQSLILSVRLKMETWRLPQ